MLWARLDYISGRELRIWWLGQMCQNLLEEASAKAGLITHGLVPNTGHWLLRPTAETQYMSKIYKW